MAERHHAPGTELYSVLGLTPDAGSQEIRAAYQRLIGEIVAGSGPAIQRQAIEEAFETLGDPIRRLRYDAQASAPAPPRFQMPALRLPGSRLSIPMPRRLPFKRPDFRRVDPMLAVAIGLVAVVALVVLLLPLLRGRSAPSAPAQSVADLVPSATSTVAAQGTPPPTARPSQSPILGLTPGGFGSAGTSLVPLPQGGSPGGVLGAAQSGAAPRSEPPFLTASAINDTLRAVSAAAAVRNGPPQAAAPSANQPAAAPPPGSVLQANSIPAGLPLTSVGALPPVIGVNSAAQPSSSLSSLPVPPPTPPPPVSTPAPPPNHIAVPTGPVTANGPVSASSGVRPVATASPNRFR